MNSQTKKGMMIWRALSILTIMAVMLSAAPNAVAMGNSAPSAQEGNLPPAQKNIFQVENVGQNRYLPDIFSTGIDRKSVV